MGWGPCGRSLGHWYSIRERGTVFAFWNIAHNVGGALTGTNNLVGSVTNLGGTLSPGASPGKLTITGNYVQGSGAAFAVELGGTTPGTGFDLLAAVGAGAEGGVDGAGAFGFLLGGAGAIGVVTFARFFALHVLILPPLTMLLIGVHIYLVRKHGVTPEAGDTAPRKKFYPGRSSAIRWLSSWPS
jgi:hypothetical protein